MRMITGKRMGKEEKIVSPTITGTQRTMDSMKRRSKDLCMREKRDNYPKQTVRTVRA